jgi:sulfatase maturation enzyme AslB (radical SAM superfamily)
MEISNLTFIVTDDCNFNCSYCVQKKEKKTINNTCIETVVDFFYPYLKSGSDDKVYINFYGGEPLLAYEKIKHATLLLQDKNKAGNKKIEFVITTNGSLLTDETLDFFHHHKFVILLSFDGLAQDKSRKKGTLDQMVRVMKQIQGYPQINLEINSVFSPQTVRDLSESMRFIIELNGPEITFNLSTMEEWRSSDLESLKEELERLEDFLVLFYKKTGTIPVKNFQTTGEKKVRNKSPFHCSAGRHQVAVTPEGKVWGCFLFHDYFKTRENDPQYQDYYFGTVTDFIANHETCYPEVLANYSELRQDFFTVEGKKANFCFLCEYLEGCMVCPVNAAYSTGSLGKISCRQCKLMKIQRNAHRAFRQKLGEF